MGIFVVITNQLLATNTRLPALKKHPMAHKLPIGIQDFETIRTENYLYVDKTQLLYQMITKGAMYFLSRPRRFGKSLLVSTLHAIFQGERHLFQGLWIDQSDYTWEHHPVVWLDMSGIENASVELLQQSLNEQLDKIAKQYGVELTPSVSVSGRLNNLITELAEAKNKKVVVLIDEYDKPLVDQIHRPEIALENREILKQFYGILKVQNANIRFVLLTGVSKFSKVSVFSGLNNLEDISLLSEYATLLGYTQEELTNYFSLEIDNLAQKEGLSRQALLNEVKHWYNGYRFSEEETFVYNPFSTLLLFKQQKFSVHWFATGTPTFLVNLIQERQFDIANIENLKIRETDLSVFEIEKLSVLPLLYQTGYLTIKSYNRESGYYELGYPNREVEVAFLESLLARFSNLDEPVQSSFIFDMVAALKKQSFTDFFQLLKGFLASIPYDLHMPGEKYYQNIFYFVFNLVGLRSNAEVHTNRGRIDAVIEGKDWILIFELKVDKSAQEALEQIKTKGYAEPYMSGQKAIYLIGLNFNSAERNVSEYIVERIGVPSEKGI
jgi:vacuolar-type H+-ATPase subunit E/Vma4